MQDPFETPSFLTRLNEALMTREQRETNSFRRDMRRQLSVPAIQTNTTSAEVAALQMKVLQLEDSLLSLGLYTRTILQLLVEKGVTNTPEFQAQFDALDALDGKADGK